MNSKTTIARLRRMLETNLHIGRIRRRLWRCAVAAGSFCVLAFGLVSYGQQSSPVVQVNQGGTSATVNARQAIQAPEPQPLPRPRLSGVSHVGFEQMERSKNSADAGTLVRRQSSDIGPVYSTWRRNPATSPPMSRPDAEPSIQILPNMQVPHSQTPSHSQTPTQMHPMDAAELRSDRFAPAPGQRPVLAPLPMTPGRVPVPVTGISQTAPVPRFVPQVPQPMPRQPGGDTQRPVAQTPPVHVYPERFQVKDSSLPNPKSVDKTPAVTSVVPPSPLTVQNSAGPIPRTQIAPGAFPAFAPRPQATVQSAPQIHVYPERYQLDSSQSQQDLAPPVPSSAEQQNSAPATMPAGPIQPPAVAPDVSRTFGPRPSSEPAPQRPTLKVHVYPEGVRLRDPPSAPTADRLSTEESGGRPISVYPRYRSSGDESTTNSTDSTAVPAESNSEASEAEVSVEAAAVPLRIPARPISASPSRRSGHSFGHPDQSGGGMAPNVSVTPAPMPLHVQPVPVDATAVVDSGDAEAEREIFWWEKELPQPMLRGRQACPLTLQQALGLALTEAPELQVLHSDWFMRQIEITRHDAAFDWTSFVDSIWNRDSVPVGSNLDGAVNRLRSRTLNAGAGVRRLGRDGSELEISQRLGTRSSNSIFINPNNQGTTRLGFTYEKPLMRGGGEDYNSGRVRLAATENDAAFDRFQAGVQDHLLAVSTEYWTLVMQRGRFLQAVNSWNRARQIADEMATRVEIDVTPNMLDRARSEVASRLATAIEAEHDTIQAQDGLLRLIYGAHYTNYADQEVVTLTLPVTRADVVDPGPQIQTALHNRSEIHEAIRDIKAASIRYDLAANEVLPMLDLVLTGYVAGLERNNNIGQSFLNQFSQGEPGVGIGFNFEVPYRNRAAQATAEQGFIAMKRMKAQLEFTIGEVTEDVREQVIQRNKFGAVLKQQWESLARAKRILKYTQTRREVLADGVAVADLYLENLLLMQNRLAQAELSYLESQVRFSLADNALLRAVSELDTLADRTACGPNGMSAAQ
ncbi:MAG: TolC family protein [Planctomycetaceae bacterium]